MLRRIFNMIYRDKLIQSSYFDYEIKKILLKAFSINFINPDNTTKISQKIMSQLSDDPSFISVWVFFQIALTLFCLVLFYRYQKETQQMEAKLYDFDASTEDSFNSNVRRTLNFSDSQLNIRQENRISTLQELKSLDTPLLE